MNETDMSGRMSEDESDSTGEFDSLLAESDEESTIEVVHPMKHDFAFEDSVDCRFLIT